MTETSPSSSTDNMNSYTLLPNIPSTTPSAVENNQTMILLQSKQPNSCPSSFPSSSHAVDDLHKLVNFQRPSLLINSESADHPHHDHYNPNNNNIVPDLLSNFSTLQPHQPQAAAVNIVPGSFQAAFSDRLWDWNAVPEAGKDYAGLFK
ncbi:UNVERIFIED_CONTAM: hypothetical protein Sradi_1483700 [Sesamum radiatum]|uniref:Uncharacterized protein n=1 Tax=Sesamum radiatum TaxID=300843 RepID=A0AAW2U7A7_SESRA